MQGSQQPFGRPQFAIVMLLIIGAGHGQAQRSVDGTVLVSAASPSVMLRLDSLLTHVGSQHLVLGAADAEQYLFVGADGPRIRRLYWVQFEGYRDTFHTYDYSADSSIEVQGRQFQVDYRHYPPSGFAGPPGSDGDFARRLLEREGYELAPDLGRVRLVWLWDAAAQHELMIIYVEDLAAHGLTLDDLCEDPVLWERFRKGLLDRALEGLSILSSP